MKVLKQLGIILGICLLGEVTIRLLPFSFPSSVISLIILAVLLAVKVLKEEQIKETADFLAGAMAMFFIPPSIGIFEELELLKGQLLAVCIVVLISLLFTFLSASFSAILIQKIQRRIHHERNI
ncbi:CidA/LrgA family protein [Lachnospiraceae bacterium LCP25S3_G4]